MKILKISKICKLNLQILQIKNLVNILNKQVFIMAIFSGDIIFQHFMSEAICFCCFLFFYFFFLGGGGVGLLAFNIEINKNEEGLSQP